MKFLGSRSTSSISTFDPARLETSRTKLDIRKLKMPKNAYFVLAMWTDPGHIRHQVSEASLDTIQRSIWAWYAFTRHSATISWLPGMLAPDQTTSMVNLSHKSFGRTERESSS